MILKYVDKEGREFLLKDAQRADLPRFVRALRVDTDEVMILHENDLQREPDKEKE